MNVPNLRNSDTAGLAAIRRWQPCAIIAADMAATTGDSVQPIYFNISYGLAAQAHYPWAARMWELKTPPKRPAIDKIVLSAEALTCLQDVLDLLEATLIPSTDYVLIQ
ncbi:MAG: hypothetical protein ABTQ73_07500 [Caldilineales bacterium]